MTTITNQIGTYRLSGNEYRLVGSNQHIAKVAKEVKRKKDYARPAIYAMLGVVVILVLTIIFGIQEVKDARSELQDTRSNLKEYVKKANQMVLDATLGQIEEIEKDRVDMTEKMFGLTSNSVKLTEEMQQ